MFTCGAKPAHTVVLSQGPTVKPGLALNLEHSPDRPGTGASHHLPSHKLPLSLDLSPKVKKQSTTATCRALFKGTLAETFRIYHHCQLSSRACPGHLHSPSVHSPLPGGLVPVCLPGWSGGGPTFSPLLCTSNPCYPSASLMTPHSSQRAPLTLPALELGKSPKFTSDSCILGIGRSHSHGQPQGAHTRPESCLLLSIHSVQPVEF